MRARVEKKSPKKFPWASLPHLDHRFRFSAQEKHVILIAGAGWGLGFVAPQMVGSSPAPIVCHLFLHVQPFCLPPAKAMDKVFIGIAPVPQRPPIDQTYGLWKIMTHYLHVIAGMR